MSAGDITNPPLAQVVGCSTDSVADSVSVWYRAFTMYSSSPSSTTWLASSTPVRACTTARPPPNSAVWVGGLGADNDFNTSWGLSAATTTSRRPLGATRSCAAMRHSSGVKLDMGSEPGSRDSTSARVSRKPPFQHDATCNAVMVAAPVAG